MIRKERVNIIVDCFYMLLDLVLFFIAFFLPYTIRWNLSRWQQSLLTVNNIHDFLSEYFVQPFFFISHNWQTLFFPVLEEYSRIYIFWAIILFVLLYVKNLYRTDRLLSTFHEAGKVINAVLLSALVTGLVTFFIKAVYISRFVFVANIFLLCLFLSGWRAFKRLIIRKMIRQGYNNFNILIIGANKLSADFLREVKSNSCLGWKIVGVLDDSAKKGDTIEGVPVVGCTNDLEKIVRACFVDEVVITIMHDWEKVTRLVAQAKELNTSVKVIPDPFQLSMDVISMYRIGTFPVLDYSLKKLHGSEAFGKRVMDVVFSGALLIVLSPFLLVIAAAIKICDGGPVFYVSKRYGKKGDPFDMYKFRSMAPNADDGLAALKEKNEKDGPIFKIKDDPRVTAFGRFLRKFSLDELPQFFNVLKGDMSLVGPRPFPLGQIEENDFRQFKRMEIKPGITGLWQIRGRSDTSFYQLIKWDTWYINNWSLWLDFVIIFNTLPAVLKGRGAY